MSENSSIQGTGFWRRILFADLSSGSFSFEQPDESVYHDFLSGAGLGIKVLWDRMKPGADPLGPDNILGFTTGLLTGTGSFFTGRFTVIGKSPLSGSLGDANAGGSFSYALKRCGIDALFCLGAAERPVYLFIDETSAQILDASHLWGKDTIETEEALKKAHGKEVEVACIGPAGEALSRISGIATDEGRMAARGGLGAVLGSKKLKAVVAAGKAKITVADRSKMASISRDFLKRFKRLDFLKGVLNDRILAMSGIVAAKGFFIRQPAFLWRLLLKKFGTPALTPVSAESGDSPFKNWTGSVTRDFPAGRYMKLGAGAVTKYQMKKYGCYSCPLQCGGIVSMTDGPCKIEKMHKPEYETMCAFGGLLLNDDIASVFKLNDMANRAGIDTISCGGTMAFAIECYSRGIIDYRDTGGLDLNWGNAEAIIRLMEMIVRREGLGDLLADGVRIAARKIGKGSEECAVHCGGVEAPMHDPKFDPGFGVSFYCEAVPGRHTVTSYQYLDLQFLEKQFSRAAKIPLVTTRREKYDYENRGAPLAVGSFYKMLVDAAGACLFGTQLGADLPLCEWMNAATGWSLSNDEYLIIGERIAQLRHAFNLREGINPIHDFRPHPRVYGDLPLNSGPLKGVRLDLEKLAASFYEAMHWDVTNGKPDGAYLEFLGLSDVAEQLS
ncbi:MAG: aldehyde ferredoxin oxidoreductase family protein [Desulfomonile tiedjei]|uniref:Aldehyde ferredoxin oxidoreductase family protein n=1 Tax=Desulfomonile tiedjei TaxID=2358 RepID=A0A9D6V614_9BACT|nr:aldehyde ferredoxin oxidoreductase family protein [Desulfomonile tiedjei]